MSVLFFDYGTGVVFIFHFAHILDEIAIPMVFVCIASAIFRHILYPKHKFASNINSTNNVHVKASY